MQDSLDQSQLAALCAVQNLNRPIVAVHGPPGTGKTMLLVRHLQQLKKQVFSEYIYIIYFREKAHLYCQRLQLHYTT